MVKIKHLLVLCLWIQLSQALFFDLFKPKSVKRHYTRPSRTYYRPKSVSRPTSVARSGGQWTPITKTTYKNQPSYKSNSRSTTSTYTSKNTYTPTKTYTYPSSTYTTYTSNSHGTYTPSSTSYTYINYPYKTISRRPVSRRIVNKQLIKVNKVIPTMTFNDPKTTVMDSKKTPETNIENDAPNRINIDDLLSIGLPFEGTEVRIFPYFQQIFCDLNPLYFHSRLTKIKHPRKLKSLKTSLTYWLQNPIFKHYLSKFKIQD